MSAGGSAVFFFWYLRSFHYDKLYYNYTLHFVILRFLGIMITVIIGREDSPNFILQKTQNVGTAGDFADHFARTTDHDLPQVRSTCVRPSQADDLSSFPAYSVGSASSRFSGNPNAPRRLSCTRPTPVS